MSFDNRDKGESKGKPPVDPKDAQLIFDVMYSEFGPTLEERREILRSRFGDAPIPHVIIDAGLALAQDDAFRAHMTQQLAELRGAEMLPWVEQFLRSPHLNEAGEAAIALLYIDEPRALSEMEHLYKKYLGRDRETGFYLGNFLFLLREHGTPQSMALIDELKNL
jgi:uncharacterized ferritin-like protein (DUF455 family)